MSVIYMKKKATKSYGIEQLKLEDIYLYACMYIIQVYLHICIHTHMHACMYIRLSCTFTLTSLSIYEWILFQKQELFNMRIQKSVFVEIIHTYKHILLLLVRPPDYFNFVSRQAVPSALAS